MGVDLMLRTRFDEHISRKIFHILSGSTIAFLYIEVIPRKEAAFLLLLATLVLASFDLLRLSMPSLNHWVLRIYGPLMREEEKDHPSAQLYYLIGLCWAVLFLPKAIGVQAILTLAWMDPVAGLYGVRFGKRRWNSIFGFFLPDERKIPISLGAKTFEGSLAGFIAAFLAGIVAWTGPWAAYPLLEGGLYWPSPFEVFLLSVVGAFVAVVSEAWPSQWDDNAKIPFWTGLLVWAVAALVGMPLSFN
jgi:dolichol kinase